MNFANRVLSIQSKKPTRRLRDYLRKDELDAILDATDRSIRQGRRDYALLLFLTRTGARVSEAIGLRRSKLMLRKSSSCAFSDTGLRGLRQPRSLVDSACSRLREKEGRG